MSTHTLTPRRLKLYCSPDADPENISPDQLLHQVPACRDAEEGTCPSHAVPLAGEDAGKIDRVADWGLYLINRDMVVLSPLSHVYPVCSDSTATYRKSEKKKIYICMAYVFLRDFLAMH